MIQYLIQDTLCELLLLTIELRKTVGTISDSRYSVWTSSTDSRYTLWTTSLHHWMIMTLDTISDSRYSVWTKSPHHWVDTDSWYNIWIQIPSVNHFFTFEIIRTLDTLSDCIDNDSWYNIWFDLIFVNYFSSLIQDIVWTASPHHWFDNDNW